VKDIDLGLVISIRWPKSSPRTPNSQFNQFSHNEILFAHCYMSRNKQGKMVGRRFYYYIKSNILGNKERTQVNVYMFLPKRRSWHYIPPTP
jgi:hypothetical protein